MALPQSANSTQRTHRHLNDTATCLDLIDRGISHIKAQHLTKYRELFQAVRNKVYAKAPTAMDSQNLIYDDIMYSMGDGVEAYVNQVSEFLDGGGFNVDEALDAWYDALMGEIQSGGDSTMA